MRDTALGLLALSLLGGGIARADEITPPPRDCAPGAVAHSSHWGPWCEDTRCASDADCAPHGDGASSRFVCRRVSACVLAGSGEPQGPATLESPRGSFHGPGTPVSGRCGAGRTCAEAGQACVQARRCVDAALGIADEPEPGAVRETPPSPTEPSTVAPSAPPPAEESGGGGCAVGRAAGGGVIVPCLIAIAIAIRVRRR